MTDLAVLSESILRHKKEKQNLSSVNRRLPLYAKCDAQITHWCILLCDSTILDIGAYTSGTS